MLELYDMQFDVSVLQILEDLRLSLQQNNIYLLKDIKQVGDNVMVTCPFHKDGQERKPSCGVSIKDTYKGRLVIVAGTVHCFTCGHTCSLDDFISHCFGYKDGGRFGLKWLKANYGGTLGKRERKLELNINRQPVTNNKYATIPDEILDTFRYTVPYMYKRGLTDELIEKFDIGYDSSEDTITIPVKDLNGEVKWIQRRYITYKRYVIPSGITKTDFLLGAYECLQCKDRRPVYIVESPFNMLTLWKLGHKAICLFGTGGGNQYNMLKELPFRHYILALDNDEAGKEGTKKLIQYLQHSKRLSIVKYKDSRDINELDEDFNNTVISNFI